MSRLNRGAKGRLRLAGVTQAAFIRWAGWADGKWHGDECGCLDDRCIGYHHDETDECGCLSVFIDQLQRPATTNDVSHI